MITIYHKSNCSTSLEALRLLKQNTKEEIKIIEYLFNTPTQIELKHLLKMLNLKAENLVRKKEAVYKEQFSDKKFTTAQWLKILNKNPILIERPIIVKNEKAIIARPPEILIDFIKNN